MKKYQKIILTIVLILCLGINIVHADDETGVDNGTDASTTAATNDSNLDKPKTAEAQVLKVLGQKETVRDNGSKAVQQNLELGILTGPFKGQTKVYTGISGIDVVSSNVYKVNNKVLVSYNRDETGEYVFYVTDYVRNDSLLWLTLLFIVVVLLIGSKKGIMALISLIISFFVIIKVLGEDFSVNFKVILEK